ncbi:MAG: hypothetical protein HW418_3131, partial [Anaerolineales bacterium]|nr:hypothetical protein [Anaerolineales bacterium]
MEDFQHALDPPLGDEGHAVIGNEAFARQQRGAGQVARGLLEVGDVDDAALQRGDARVAFAHPQLRVLKRAGAEAAPGGIAERLRAPVEQQDGGGVHAQARGDLIEKGVEGDAQVQAGGDGDVNIAQGLQAFEAAV